MIGVKNAVRKAAARLFKECVDHDLLDFAEIERRLDDLKTRRCYLGAKVAESSRFYETSKVYNLQDDPEAISLGKNTHVRGELIVFPYGGRIETGEGCYVGEGTRIWSGEKIVLGDFVGIAHNVNIMDFAHETHFRTRAEGVMSIFANGHPREKGDIPTAPIVIEDYAAIYANASILRGVRIGKGAIVSTGSVVMADVAPFTIVMGNPARPMGKLPAE